MSDKIFESAVAEAWSELWVSYDGHPPAKKHVKESIIKYEACMWSVDMEAAPKDGTHFLAQDVDGFIFVCKALLGMNKTTFCSWVDAFSVDEFDNEIDREPVQWRKIPNPPVFVDGGD